MSDGSYNNGGERESERRVHRDDGTLSSDSDERELLRMLRENPELQELLRKGLNSIPRSDPPAKPPLSSSSSTFPDASIPVGLPIAGRSSSRSRIPSGLPTATRSVDRSPSLPDAFRQVDPTPTPFGFTTSDPRALPNLDVPPTSAVPPSSVEFDAALPQQVPVPPRTDNLDAPSKDVSNVPEDVAVATSKRRKGKADRKEAKKETADREPESAPDLSTMAPLSSSLEGDFTALGAMIAGFPATTSVVGLGRTTPDALGILTTDDTWNQSTPDAFLELLEKRDAQTEETANATREVELIRSRTALENAANDAPMWLLSLLLHVVLIIVLAFLVVNVEIKDLFQVVSEPGFSDDVVLDDVFDPDAAFETVEDANFDATDMPEVETEVVADVPDVSAFTEETAAPLTMMETSLALDAAPVGEVENLLGSLSGDDLSGRGENKAAALATGGGTEGSEKSVALALAWLAEHQRPDGSWSFKLGQCPSCGGKCRNSGANDSTIAATAMGVLPFLAAGNTPTRGKYKRVVAKGVDYLLKQGVENENGMAFNDGPGNMYSHGLAAIAICETYAMLTPRERTRYRQLEYVVQETTSFIEYAQAIDGGWRYSPKQAGDTSVSGWQMMALKSAELAGLRVSSPTLTGMRSFLRDVVAVDDGAGYSYMRASSRSNSTDSIGLLCRLYLDWRVDNPDLLRGAKRLAEGDRSLNNPYYLYYVSQLLHNVGGRVWNEWNREMREKLINAQQMEGHERGSWYPDNPGPHCDTGGRLYATSLNCMVLEVYYRHMPLYQKMEASESFPLEGPGADNKASAASAEQDDPDEDFPVEDFLDEDDKE